jgi:hypothetical protein
VLIDNQFVVYGLAGAGAYFVNGKITFTVAGIGRALGSDNTTVWEGLLEAGMTYITPEGLPRI